MGNFGSALERSEEHTSELQSLTNLVCRLLLEKKNKKTDYAGLLHGDDVPCLGGFQGSRGMGDPHERGIYRYLGDQAGDAAYFFFLKMGPPPNPPLFPSAPLSE